MVFPLSLQDMVYWLAIMTMIVLATAELISPYYGQSNLVLNKRRLRKAALVIGILFLILVAIQAYVILIYR